MAALALGQVQVRCAQTSSRVQTWRTQRCATLLHSSLRTKHKIVAVAIGETSDGMVAARSRTQEHEMDLHQAQALALIEEGRPDSVRATLRDSGYGELAEQWLQASNEFETVARSSLAPAGLDGMERPVNTDVLRAYARMCLSWSRISQLRDQALGWMERRE